MIELDVEEIGPSLRYAMAKPKVGATEQRQDTSAPMMSRPSRVIGSQARLVAARLAGPFRVQRGLQAPIYTIAVDEVTGHW
ncbi:MAG TPA: hypothetical protein VE673_12650 [Pseudonocardiaceae bacterium]|nr:hypothetical protein [Pseudonocardiaceae bacterium]